MNERILMALPFAVATLATLLTLSIAWLAPLIAKLIGAKLSYEQKKALVKMVRGSLVYGDAVAAKTPMELDNALMKLIRAVADELGKVPTPSQEHVIRGVVHAHRAAIKLNQ